MVAYAGPTKNNKPATQLNKHKQMFAKECLGMAHVPSMRSTTWITMVSPTRIMHCATLQAIVHSKRKDLLFYDPL